MIEKKVAVRFRQLDRIVSLDRNQKIVASRTLSGGDRFFDDHFPKFPVLPGVMSLEMMFQACDWLVRRSDDFNCSMVILKEVRNAKFSGFVRPGQELEITAEIKSQDGNETKLMTKVSVEGKAVASARMVVEQSDLATIAPSRAALDQLLHQQKSIQYELISPENDNPPPVETSHYRWMWIDRLTEFRAEKSATAIKTVSMTDEPLDLYMPGYPILPCSLILEGLAQTGGMLVNELTDFEQQLVLAKVSKVSFHRSAVSGDTMTYSTEITDVASDGYMVRGKSEINGQPHAECELVFVNVQNQLDLGELMAPQALLLMLRLYGLYDVGKQTDGTPLTPPQRLMDAENQYYKEDLDESQITRNAAEA